MFKMQYIDTHWNRGLISGLWLQVLHKASSCFFSCQFCGTVARHSEYQCMIVWVVKVLLHWTQVKLSFEAIQKAQ